MSQRYWSSKVYERKLSATTVWQYICSLNHLVAHRKASLTTTKEEKKPHLFRYKVHSGLRHLNIIMSNGVYLLGIFKK